MRFIIKEQFILLILFTIMSCSDKSTNPTSGIENNIIISTKIIEGETLPKNAILDTLLYQSNVELFLSTCYSDTNEKNIQK